MGGAWSISSILASHFLCDLEQVAHLLCAQSPVKEARLGEFYLVLPVFLLLEDVLEGPISS